MIAKSLPTTVALGLLLSALPVFAQSAFEREAKDRAEIEKLITDLQQRENVGPAGIYFQQLDANAGAVFRPPDQLVWARRSR